MMGSSSSKIDNNVPSSGKVMSSTVSPAVNSSTAADTATAEKVKVIFKNKQANHLYLMFNCIFMSMFYREKKYIFYFSLVRNLLTLIYLV